MSDPQSEFAERYGGNDLRCPAGFPVQAGTKEWVVEKGDKGDKGDKGERGATGNDATRLPVSQGRAVVYLFVLAVLLAATCLAGLVYYGHRLSAQQSAQQAAERRAGGAIERAICINVGTMAAIQPPAGAPASNPSRAYEQAEHRAWSGLYADLGCRR